MESNLMVMDIIEQTKTKMLAALDHLKNELKSIRTGRASPGMVENIMVEAYGTQMRLKDMASITTPEPRLVQIQPFDKSNTNAIGKAIEKSNIGITPIVDANIVRLKVPEMSESVRKETAKVVHKKCEECKVGIRNIRRDSNEFVRKQKSSGEIGEDILKTQEKIIQDLTDKFCKEADEIAIKKEREIMAV
jgi:ribosome recycling factor